MSMLKLEPSSVVLTDTILGSLHNKGVLNFSINSGRFVNK